MAERVGARTFVVVLGLICSLIVLPVQYAFAAVSLSSQPTPTASVGQPIINTVTFAGGDNPTGTLIVNLFEPGDVLCVSGMTSYFIPVTGNGSYTTEPFFPSAPGTYRWTAFYVSDANNDDASIACNDPNTTTVVTQAGVKIVTQATAAATVGQPIIDTARLSEGDNPTGFLRFFLYGPDDETCLFPPIFSPHPTEVDGNGSYDSPPFIPTVPGVYRWVASYEGDANNPPISTACNDPNETTVVSTGAMQIVTQATPTANVGQPITDTATISGGDNPTGTITFSVYGPTFPIRFDCSGQPTATSTVPVNGNGSYTSEPHFPTQVGTYRWTALYSGDANNPALGTACNEPGETTFVNPLPAFVQVISQATPNAPLGGSIMDSATVIGSGFNPPSGTVTFMAFGPNNPGCTGDPAFMSQNRALTPAGPDRSAATSETFVPQAPGTYNWVALYSGDANYVSVMSPCGAENETSQIDKVQPTMTTNATPTAAVGDPVTDTVTITGPPGAPTPTGNVIFAVFSSQSNCGLEIFSSEVTLSGSPVATATSAPFIPTQPGTYHWVAFYGGDASYHSKAGTCGEANETTVVTAGPSEPACTITGTGRSESLTGTAGPDVICGLGGDDQILGLGGDDILIGGSGSDKIEGGAGGDTLYGGIGDDSLSGGAGPDRLFGGAGSDQLDGGNGSDQLFGERGSDKLIGGGGNDTGDGGPGRNKCDSTEHQTSC